MSNKVVTFKDFDKLNLKSFAENLFQIIEKGLASPIEELGEKGSYTISLSAQFGNGKTTFLKMVEQFITEEKSNYNVLFLNVWELDFYGEPVIAILSEFVNWLEQPSENSRTKQGTKGKQDQSDPKTGDTPKEQQMASNATNRPSLSLKFKSFGYWVLSKITTTKRTPLSPHSRLSRHSRLLRHSREDGNPEKPHTEKIKQVISMITPIGLDLSHKNTSKYENYKR